MASLTPVYSTNRSVREYLEGAYLPAATSYRGRASDAGALGREISAWRRALDAGWDSLQFGAVTADTRAERHHFAARLKLGDLAPSLRIELYADASGRESSFKKTMTRVEGQRDAAGMWAHPPSGHASRRHPGAVP